MASRNSSAVDRLTLEYERVLDRVAGAVRGVLGSGRVPDQVPAIADADPHVFGLAVATVEGKVHGVGEWRRRFSIQSISKVFTLALVIENYVRHCAIAMSCAGLAVAGGFLARHGVRRDGSRLMSRSDAKRIHAVMLTCGTYDAAGEFAYRVGLPAKSGVAGGILAIIPGRCSLCVWSPGLDDKGNSIAGIAALDAFTTLTGWSVF